MNLDSVFNIRAEKQENMNINIVFVGFDEYYTLEENYEYLPTNVDPFQYLHYNHPLSDFPCSDYNISYTFSSLTSGEANAMAGYMDLVSEETEYLDSRVNISAVEEYEITEEYDDISDFFIPCEGMLIDAESIENYIEKNYYSNLEQKTGYTLYMLNFSQFDNPDHSYEHTYGYTLGDNDAMSLDPEHYTSTIPRRTIGWGGNERFCFIDISAISNAMFYYSFVLEIPLYALPAYTLYDLDSYTQTIDPYTQDGKDSLIYYISTWINSYLHNNFLSRAVYFPPVDENINLPIAVFTNISDKGYPLESISWAISSERIGTSLSDSFPWINFFVPIKFYNLSDYPEIYNHLAQNVQEDEDGYFIDVMDVAEIMDEKLDLFFDMEYEGTQSLSLVFINNYVRFKIDNINLGGIALGKYQISVRNPNQLFHLSDVNQPMIGLTHTIVHEIGHNLGLSHPHSGAFGFGSMFIKDVMSYLYSAHNFSIFSRDTIARFHYDYYYLNAQGNLTALENPNVRGYGKVTKLLEESYSYYAEMDYIPAIEKAMEAHKLSLELTNAMRKPGILSVIVVSSAVVASIPIVIISFKPFARIKG